MLCIVSNPTPLSMQNRSFNPQLNGTLKLSTEKELLLFTQKRKTTEKQEKLNSQKRQLLLR